MSKSDRELLELAAKAAGIEIKTWSEDAGLPWIERPSIFCLGEMHLVVWNPLTDDGDCARVEVACELQVDIGDIGVISERRGDAIECFERYTDHGDDRNKTRRIASVRAAAAIGEQMP